MDTDSGAVPVQIPVHLVLRHQTIHGDAVDDQPPGQGQGKRQTAVGEAGPADLPQGRQQEQGHHHHAPVGHAALEAEPVGPHVQRHPPGGGGQQHQALQTQQGGQQPEDRPGPPLPPGGRQGGHGDGEIDSGHAHHLEKAAAGPLGVADAPLGKVLRAAEEPGGLDGQEAHVQQVQRRQHQDKDQTVGGALRRAVPQRFGMAETVQKAEEEGRQRQPPDQLLQGGGEVGPEKGPQVLRDGGEQRVGGGQHRHQQRHQQRRAETPQDHRYHPPGDPALFAGGQSGGDGAQMPEQAPQQETKPLPQHGGPPPGEPDAAGEGQGVDRQQHQQGHQVPEPEVPVGAQGQRDGQKQVEQQQSAVGADHQRRRAGDVQHQGVPGEHGGGQAGGGAVPQQSVRQQHTEHGGKQQHQPVLGQDFVDFDRILGRLRRPSRRQGIFGMIHIRFSYHSCPYSGDSHISKNGFRTSDEAGRDLLSLLRVRYEFQNVSRLAVQGGADGLQRGEAHRLGLVVF